MKRLPFLLLALMTLPMAMRLQAQSSYTASSIPYNPDPFVTSSPITQLFDDTYSGKIAMPFPFCFYGSTYDTLLIGSNGILSFDISQASQYCPWPISSPLPSTSLPSPAIFTPTQDLDPSQGGTISVGTYGVAPYRRYVVSYEAIPMFSCSSINFTQQVILYETTNIIELHIQNKPLCPTWNSGYAILGMQGSQTDFVEVPGHTVPSTWTAMNESWRFSPTSLPCYSQVSRDSVSGKVYMDVNANCILDGSDFNIGNAAVIANGGQYYDWTDASGEYLVEVDTGNWTITHFIPGPHGVVCPTGGTYNPYFATTGLHSMNNDFADTVNVYCPDLTVDIGAVNFSRCQSETMQLQWCNLGWMPETNVVVTVTLTDSIWLDSATVPYTSLGGNVYQINVGNLAPFQCASASLFTHIGCDSVGVVYCVNASISGVLADCDTLNNLSMDCHPLIGSFDPNDKRVAAHNFAQAGWVHTDTITANARLNYMIRFQNTGNDTAYTVIVRDTISGLVDPQSIIMGASSHAYHYFILNNVLHVQFDNILLPDSGANMDASMGFFRYTAVQMAGNLPGNIIPNQAAIYFDSNPPIFTNTTEQVIGSEVIVQIPEQLEVKLYPNPGMDRMVLEWTAEGDARLVLRNLLGQVVIDAAAATDRVEVPTAALNSGIYLWQLERQGQILAHGKWMKH